MNKQVSSKEEILETAKSLLLSGGEKSLSLREIAKTRGISLGAIYTYYRSKDEIIGALMESFWKDVFFKGLCEDDLNYSSSLEVLSRASQLLKDNYAAFSSLFSLSSKSEAPKRMFSSPYIVHFVQEFSSLLQKEDPLKKVFHPPISYEEYSRFVFASLINGTLRGDNDVLIGIHKELIRRIKE